MKTSLSCDGMRSLAFNLDACYTGFYFWVGSFSLRIGGVEVDDNPYPYCYIVPTFIGFGFCLAKFNYFSWHTPFSKFKKIEIKQKTEWQKMFDDKKFTDGLTMGFVKDYPHSCGGYRIVQEFEFYYKESFDDEPSLTAIDDSLSRLLKAGEITFDYEWGYKVAKNV